MGWLFMPSLGQFDTPKAYLEDQFTYVGETKISTVIESAMIAMRTWYAACRQVDKSTGRTEVFAIVCLVRYNRRDKEGMIFGYKDMTEHMGPCESECPAPILDLLTPTDSEYALKWRQRCRDHRAKQSRPPPRDGDLVVFVDRISFSDGYESNRFRFAKRQRGSYFTRPDGTGAYRIRNWKSVAWTIVPAIAATQLSA